MRLFIFIPMAALLSTVSLTAQITQYSLEIDSNQAYSDLTNTTYDIPENDPLFGNVFTKGNINFEFFSATYNLSNINTYIPLKEGYFYCDNGSRSATIYACKGDFTGNPGPMTSVFSFKREQSSGDRKFILQWKNMGFTNGTASDYINFQAWLYEASGVIEIRFGNSSVSPGLYENGSNGPTIGLLEMDASFNTIYNEQWLDGSPATPSLVTTSAVINLLGTPKPGMVYRFVPMGPDLTRIRQVAINTTALQAYPNPLKDKMVVSTGNAGMTNITIFNCQGQQIYSDDPHSDSCIINTSGFASGLYVISVKDEKGLTHLKKLVKE